jgi:hypothetical protein
MNLRGLRLLPLSFVRLATQLKQCNRHQPTFVKFCMEVILLANLSPSRQQHLHRTRANVQALSSLIAWPLLTSGIGECTGYVTIQARANAHFPSVLLKKIKTCGKRVLDAKCMFNFSLQRLSQRARGKMGTPMQVFMQMSGSQQSRNESQNCTHSRIPSCQIS